ncbi:M24 family metallopeptidase [Modestobacter sp. Leaf380]|uniref:M24 family metallopeptidase n=1 Tax=Modestobacter sp. Leaf380 TaxID=1736356 RepID=UPI0006F30115|nr:M24 family metallopeptidase [Modestobacter sp. Leaf380]KQS66304.1 Xaa-Pro aminopeptidase [Modestobacter sp. Leaf380]
MAQGLLHRTAGIDPTAVVPLPLRDQAEVRDRWLTQRLQDLLPDLMDDAGIDLWVVVGREYNEDPVLPTLLPASWLSARRRTILLLHRSDDGVTPMAVARYPVGQFVQAWDPDDDEPGATAEQSQWAAVRRVVEQARPRAIGVDVSATFAHADGLSHTEHGLLVDALGPWAERMVPAEQLAVRWLETRLPEEVKALHAMNALVHDTIAEAFSPAVVTVGQTTALDVAWWIRQRFHDLGVEPWFQPTVGLQRAGVPLLDERGTVLAGVPHDAVVGPGDLLHCDVGLKTLGLTTDTQRNAYVLRPGETAPPAGLVHALAVGNRMQDLVTEAMVPGRTGDQVLAAARAAAAAEGVDGDVYSHPVGFYGHGAGPAIGMWDAQGGVPGTGAVPVRTDTTWALELCVRVPVPEWDGQLLRMALEQGIALTADGVSYLDARQTELLTL